MNSKQADAATHMPQAAQITANRLRFDDSPDYVVDHFLQCSGCGKGCLHVTSNEPLLLTCCECGAVWDDGANRQCNAYGQGHESGAADVKRQAIALVEGYREHALPGAERQTLNALLRDLAAIR